MFSATHVSRTAAQSLVLSIAFFGFLGFNASAMADEAPSGARSKQVVLKDLDLSTQDGQRVALERVRDMARSLCSQVSDHLDLAHQPHYVACVDKAMTQATANLQAMVSRKSPTLLAQAK